VLLERVQDGFGVGARLIAVPGLLECWTERGLIIYLAVKGDPERAGLVRHRLVAALDVDDAEAPLGEVRPRVVIKTKVVGAAMSDRIGHSRQGRAGAGVGG
jgi:hypothetical protein